MSSIDENLVFAIFPPDQQRPVRKRRSLSSLRVVNIEGRSSRLSRTEHALLIALARHNGKTVTYAQLYKDVFADRQLKNAVHLRMYIRLLRRRIEPNPAEPRYLLTVRKRGYRLALTQVASVGEMQFAPLLPSPVHPHGTPNPTLSLTPLPALRTGT